LTPEQQRLQSGPAPAERPPAEVVTVTASTPPGSASQLLARVREVMAPVLAAPRPWPSPDGWRELLPPWFTAACSDDERVTTCVVDRWSLRAWIWWFQPEQRRWLWWDAQVTGDGLRIRVLPTGAGSLLLGSLEWLLKVAGAQEVSSA
jgi:hypothetical protein